MSVVRKATDADMTRLCRTAMHAFADDPVMRWFWPDDADYYAGDGEIMRLLFRRWLAYDTTFTTDDCVAVAAFVPPNPPVIEFEPEQPVVMPPDELLARFTAIGPILRENTPPQPHWYLNLLGTHPHWQRQGLGAMVMAPIFETCDREGLPLYLETETVANVAYYSHHGFAVRTEWDVPLGGPHMWGMLRDPKR
ncbi:MAG: putative acetyltransferase [Ilumatobacteraceae bacterium]|nr:putative acetyltransferase [Ilumatobacteraceae bacterium]